MNWQAMKFDWNHARAFLVTAEEGSLSAAARALQQTQPTLGRQVAALEEELGVLLFDRVGRGLRLTESGRNLLTHLREMGEAAAKLSLGANAMATSAEGHVTITAGDMMATHILPPILSRLHRSAPGITVEIVASNEVQNLRMREADIAIRHFRPQDPQLIARKVGEEHAHCYATRGYTDRYGVPQRPEDAWFAGIAPVERFLAEMQRRGLTIPRENVRLSSNSTVFLLEAMRRGEVVGVFGETLMGNWEGAMRIFPDFTPIRIETWLVSHKELTSNPRIRLVFDLLAEELSLAPERRSA